MTELQHTLIDHNISVAGSIPEEKSAAALGMAGNVAEAEKAFLEEVRLAPESKTNWHNLGMLYVHQSRLNVARNCFLRVHELDEKDGFAVCRIIDLSALLKDMPSVEKWCAILASMPNGEIAALAFKARAFTRCDRYQDAKKLILDAVKNYPREPDILIACGDVMMVYPTVGPAMEMACRVYARAVDILASRWESIYRQREIEGRLEIALQHRQKCREALVVIAVLSEDTCSW